jgi:predicted secreted protein
MRIVVLASAFVILWFLALQILLPIGIGTGDANTGAPANPRLGWKLGLATLAAALIWSIFYALVWTHVINI